MNKPNPDQLEQLRIRIAELCGWTDLNVEDCVDCTGRDIGRDLFGTKPPAYYTAVPDYCGSLDAVHEAEAALLVDSARCESFDSALITLIDDDETEPWKPARGFPFHAEAWKRCVALDRTLSEKPIL